MSNYPDTPQEIRDRINQILFIFDFDGTLVPQTKFIDPVTNIVQFTGFKFAINPSAFNIKWTIVTSRPIQDAALIEECLRRNNVTPTFPVMTQTIKIPEVGNEAEVTFKNDCIQYCAKNYCSHIIYVDNNEELCNKLIATNPNLICTNMIDFLIMTRYRIMECEE